MRRDGLFELIKVDVEGSYVPYSRDNISFWDLDKPFRDEYLSRPLKRLRVGAIVFVVPSFKRYKILSGFKNGLGLNLVAEMKPMANPLAVDFGDVRVLQSSLSRNGTISKVLLLPGFRGVTN